jgi:hypothetical protein
MDSILTTTDHSWYNIITHTLRKDGTISRARIQELIMFPHCIMVRCKIEGQNRVKDEHPIIIAFVHNMWLNIDIVSEDDLPDDIETMTHVPEECCNTLPSLILGDKTRLSLNISQNKAFQYISEKINIILSLPESDENI